MESASVRNGPPLSAVVQAALISLLVGAAVLAWAVTGDRMQNMDAGPGTDLGAVGWFTGVWVVMMAAMMFPSIWPMVLVYRRIEGNRRARGREPTYGAIPAFVGGYLVAWTGAGLIAYAVFALFDSADIGFLAWDEGGRYVAAGVLFAAAAYQLTPLKDVCLTKCRNPLMFILDSWRPGRTGALRMGVAHGSWCVGCCWALMAGLLALGVMSIGWMAVIAAFIAIEKLLPWRAVASGLVTVGLAVLAIGVLASPEDVPGLTIPGSPEAMEAMEAMGMEAMGMEAMGMEAPGMEAREMSTDGRGTMEGGTMGRGAMEGGTMGRGAMEGGAMEGGAMEGGAMAKESAGAGAGGAMKMERP